MVGEPAPRTVNERQRRQNGQQQSQQSDGESQPRVQRRDGSIQFSLPDPTNDFESFMLWLNVAQTILILYLLLTR